MIRNRLWLYLSLAAKNHLLAILIGSANSGNRLRVKSESFYDDLSNKCFHCKMFRITVETIVLIDAVRREYELAICIAAQRRWRHVAEPHFGLISVTSTRSALI